jgi:glycosyltransferase involved in cell wall biosynthesis
MVSEHASPLATLGGVDAGGQNVHVAGLAAAMARHGVDVVVHTRRDDVSLPEIVETDEMTVHHVDAGPPWPVPKDELLPYMTRFARVLRDRWRLERPDVVHAHFWMSGLAALDAARPLGIPVAQTFHALGVVKRRHQGAKDTSPQGRLALERHIIRRAERIVATCTDEVAELERLEADLRRVHVVPCGTDLERFTPLGPSEARRDGLRRIVVVGRLVERKGVADVISALAEVPGAELVVAGGPPAAELGGDPEARRLAAVARDAGVEDRVRLRGRLARDEVPPLLRSADVVACVPWYEPFGIVPLEAMACGVPVIASAVGGMLDTVVDGVTGLHVAPREPSRLAAALRSLLADDERRHAMGAEGVQRARALYGWDRVARETLAVYSSVLETAPALGEVAA